MPTTIKIFFTIVIGLLVLGVLAASRKSNSAGPNYFWRMGKSDPVRILIFREDGSLRRYTKITTLLFFCILLGVIWLLIPTT